MIPTKQEIKSIYAGIENTGLGVDLQGWNSNTPIFRELIAKTRPKLIVEVGAWKGASTVHMAGICKEMGLDTVIYSVDCWVGPLGVKLCKTPRSSIPKRWDEPTFYHQFLFNIKASGHDDCVVPFQAMSVPAAQVLRDWGVFPELLYIDAAHDKFSALEDMKAYWPLLKPGGVLFGDDYRSQMHVHGHNDVGAAVRDFAASKKREFFVTNDTKDAQWWIPS